MSRSSNIHINRRGSVQVNWNPLRLKGGRQGIKEEKKSLHKHNINSQRYGGKTRLAVSEEREVQQRHFRYKPQIKSSSQVIVDDDSVDLSKWGLLNVANRPTIARRTEKTPCNDWLRSNAVAGGIEFPNKKTLKKTKTASHIIPHHHAISSAPPLPEQENMQRKQTSSIQDLRKQSDESSPSRASRDFNSFLLNIQSDLQTEYDAHQQTRQLTRQQSNYPLVSASSAAQIQSRSKFSTTPSSNRCAAVPDCPLDHSNTTISKHTKPPHKKNGDSITISDKTSLSTSPEYHVIVGPSYERKELISTIEDLALVRLKDTCEDARRVLRMFDEDQLTLDSGSPPWRGNSNLVCDSNVTKNMGGAQTAAGAANLCQVLCANLEQEVRHALTIGIPDKHPNLINGRDLIKVIENLMNSGALVRSTGDGHGAVDHYARQTKKRQTRTKAEAETLRKQSLSQIDKLRESAEATGVENKKLKAAIEKLKRDVKAHDAKFIEANQNYNILKLENTTLQASLKQSNDQTLSLRSTIEAQRKQIANLENERDCAKAEAVTLSDTLNKSLSEAFTKIGNLEVERDNIRRQAAGQEQSCNHLSGILAKITDELIAQLNSCTNDFYFTRQQKHTSNTAEHQADMPQMIHLGLEQTSINASTSTNPDTQDVHHLMNGDYVPFDEFAFVEPAKENLKLIRRHLDGLVKVCSAAELHLEGKKEHHAHENEICIKRAIQSLTDINVDLLSYEKSHTASFDPALVKNLQYTLTQLNVRPTTSTSSERSSWTASEESHTACNIIRKILKFISQASHGIPPANNSFTIFIDQCIERGEVEVAALASTQSWQENEFKALNEELNDRLEIEQAEVVRLGDALRAIEIEQARVKNAATKQVALAKNSADNLKQELNTLQDQVNFAVNRGRQTLENVLRHLMNQGKDMLLKYQQQAQQQNMVEPCVPSDVAVLICQLLREILDHIAALGCKFPSEHAANESTAVVKTAEYLLQQLQQAAENAKKQVVKIREKIQRAVQVGEGFVRTTNTKSGIQSSEYCELEDIIFDAISAAVTGPSLVGMDMDEDALTTIMDNMKHIRRAMQISLRHGEKLVQKSHSQELQTVRENADILRSDIAHEKADSVDKERQALLQRQGDALKRVDRCIKYCNVDQFIKCKDNNSTTNRDLNSDMSALYNARVTDNISNSVAIDQVTEDDADEDSKTRVTLNPLSNACMLLHEEVSAALKARVPHEHPLIQEAERRYQKLKNLEVSERKHLCSKLSRDFELLEHLLNLRQHSSVTADEAHKENNGVKNASGSQTLQKSQLVHLQQVLAAANNLRESLGDASPVCSQNDIFITNAEKILSESMALLSDNINDIQNEAAVVLDQANLVPNLVQELSQSKTDLQAQKCTIAATEKSNAAQVKMYNELTGKLMKVKTEAKQQTENLKKEVANAMSLVEQTHTENIKHKKQLHAIEEEKENAVQAYQEANKQLSSNALRRIQRCCGDLVAAIEVIEQSPNIGKQFSDGSESDSIKLYMELLKRLEIGIEKLEEEMSYVTKDNAIEDALLEAKDILSKAKIKHNELCTHFGRACEVLRTKLKTLEHRGTSLLTAASDLVHPKHQTLISTSVIVEQNSLNQVDDMPMQHDDDPINTKQEKKVQQEIAVKRRELIACSLDIGTEIRACDGILTSVDDESLLRDIHVVCCQAQSMVLKLSEKESIMKAADLKAVQIHLKSNMAEFEIQKNQAAQIILAMETEQKERSALSNEEIMLCKEKVNSALRAAAVELDVERARHETAIKSVMQDCKFAQSKAAEKSKVEIDDLITRFKDQECKALKEQNDAECELQEAIKSAQILELSLQHEHKNELLKLTASNSTLTEHEIKTQQKLNDLENSFQKAREETEVVKSTLKNELLLQQEHKDNVKRLEADHFAALALLTKELDAQKQVGELADMNTAAILDLQAKLEQAESERQAVEDVVQVQKFELSATALNHIEAEFRCVRDVTDKLLNYGERLQASGFEGKVNKNGDEIAIDDLYLVNNARLREKGLPIPPNELLFPSSSDLQKISLIEEHYGILLDCSKRLGIIAGSELVTRVGGLEENNTLMDDKVEKDISKRARQLKDRANKLSESLSASIDTKQNYLRLWHLHASASADQCLDMLRKLQQPLRDACVKAEEALHDIRTSFESDLPGDEMDAMNETSYLQKSIAENKALQAMIDALVSEYNDGASSNRENILEAVKSLIAASNRVLGGMADTEKSQSRRELLNGSFGEIVGAASADNVTALESSLCHGKKLEKHIRNISSAIKNELQDLENVLADVDGMDVPSGQMKDDKMQSLYQECESLQHEIQLRQDDFETAEKAIGKFKIPEDMSPDDGVWGSGYQAELAGDEDTDNGIINFDDLLADDGRDLTKALARSPGEAVSIATEVSDPMRRSTLSLDNAKGSNVLSTMSVKRRTTVNFKLIYIRRFVQKALVHLRFAINTKKGRDVIRSEIRAHGSKKAAKEHIVKTLVAKAENKADEQFGNLHVDDDGHLSLASDVLRHEIQENEMLKRKKYLETLDASNQKRGRASLALQQLMKREQYILKQLANHYHSNISNLENDSMVAQKVKEYEAKRSASIRALEAHTRRASATIALPVRSLNNSQSRDVKLASAIKLPSESSICDSTVDENLQNGDSESAAVKSSTVFPSLRQLPGRRLSSLQSCTLQCFSVQGLLPPYLHGTGVEDGSMVHVNNELSCNTSLDDAMDAYNTAHAATEAWRSAETWFQYIRMAITSSQLSQVWENAIHSNSTVIDGKVQHAGGYVDVIECELHVVLAELMQKSLVNAPPFAEPFASEAKRAQEVMVELQKADSIQAVKKRRADALLFRMLMLDDKGTTVDDAGADEDKDIDAQNPFGLVSYKRFLGYGMKALEQLVTLEMVDTGLGNQDELGDLVREAEAELDARVTQQKAEAFAKINGVYEFPQLPEEGRVVTIDVPVGPHFGMDLEKVPKDKITGAPAVLEELWKCITPFLSEDGVFRVSDEPLRYQRLVRSLDCGGKITSAVEDVHIVTNVIKLWLRRLPQKQRLLESLEVDQLVDAIGALKHESAEAASTRIGLNGVLGPVIDQMHPDRRAALELVLRMGVEVAAHASANRMTRSNFAVCMAPNMYADVGSRETVPLMMVVRKINAQRQLFTYLLNWYEQR